MHWPRFLGGALVLLLGWVSELSGQPSATPAAPNHVTVLDVQGRVEVARAGPVVWDPAYTNQVLLPGNRIRTHIRSRALLRLTDLTELRLNELTEFLVEPEPARFRLLQGVIYFFHRDRPADIRVNSRTASAAIRGTEFALRVDPDDRMTVTMFDGEVVLSNDAGQVTLGRGERGVAAPGQRPAKTAVLEAEMVDSIQWCLYYPAVLDPEEAGLSGETHPGLGPSLAAYRSGDLLQALALYPTNGGAPSVSGRIYLATLLLAVGEVPEAGRQIEAAAAAGAGEGGGARIQALAAALGKLIAAVKFIDAPTVLDDESGTARMAESYYQQSRGRLEEALRAARAATASSPNFGFAWARVAELEFSFGRVTPARQALEKSLQLSPRNAQALALRGFLLAARGRFAPATAAFDQAIAIDGALGNAWLGRGLCAIHQGRLEDGRLDLLTASALEPRRAVLRSYLGKAFAETGQDARARHELELAQQIDPRDPTAWLYLALLDEQDNRINEAIRGLERSQELNENRRLYRSRLLLDEDRAVRGANLANIYGDAGMTEVSVREAARAVNADYANYSAHLFLANSYDRLRDPRQINLRYETPWLNEYLLANLLAPVGAGTLSQTVSQQEYGRLFERDRAGLVSYTEYLSRGAWLESAAQYGTLGDFSYALEANYRSDVGQRPNADLDQRTFSLQAKQQVTPQDSVYAQAIWYHAESGDLVPYYNNASPFPGLRVRERQEPLLIGGYHHEWAPGHHTLFLAGWLNDRLELQNPEQPVLMLVQDANRSVLAVAKPTLPTANLEYRSEVEIIPLELQQLWERGRHQVAVGARYQFGHFDTRDSLGASTPTRIGNGSFTNALLFSTAPVAESVHSDFSRASVYGYEHWRVFDPFQLIAGLSYDRVTYPINFRAPPVSSGEDTKDQLSPKAGFIWDMHRTTTLRGAYTRSLGGVSFDQSFQLEPSQVAGFAQTYRSLIPEAVAGANAVPEFETAWLAVDQKFGQGTYFGLQGEWLGSDVSRHLGTIGFPGFNPQEVSTTPQRLEFNERSFQATLNQLLGDFWSVGARYRVSRAELETRLPAIPTSIMPEAHTMNSATLHQVNLFARYYLPSGWFAEGEGIWFLQNSHGYSPALEGDSFWQGNAFVGYRFPRRQVEIRVGLLNFTDQDYRLNPLNLTSELPRERTFITSLRLGF